MPPALQLRGISKQFGKVTALDRVDFEVARGEVHALLGENGAGKSTLMGIAFGLTQPDAGSILVQGAQVRLPDPIAARRAGIGMVHQHFTSIPGFSVAENVGLTAGWRGPPRVIRRRVAGLSQETGLDLDPDVPASSLSAGLKQRLEVLKALATDARILLLDEPTSVLSPPDAAALLQRIPDFRRRGMATVLITHKLREALEVADRVTVLRRGRVVLGGPVAGQTAASLAQAMLGAPVDRPAMQPVRAAGLEVRLECAGLAVPRQGRSGSGLRQASLSVRAGEIVGVAAVEGNGQRELLRALAGLAEAQGSLRVSQPVSFIPEDRTSEALIGGFTLTENLVLSQGTEAAWVRWPWVNWGKASERMGRLLETFELRAEGPEATAASLSGGNQQRMVIAAALERRPAVLLAENPTRGLDLQAAGEVLQRLRQAAAGGAAVVVYLSDLDELLELTHRVVVLANGILTELPPGAPREEIGRLMLGAGGHPAA